MQILVRVDALQTEIESMAQTSRSKHIRSVVLGLDQIISRPEDFPQEFSSIRDLKSYFNQQLVTLEVDTQKDLTTFLAGPKSPPELLTDVLASFTNLGQSNEEIVQHLDQAIKLSFERCLSPSNKNTLGQLFDSLSGFAQLSTMYETDDKLHELLESDLNDMTQFTKLRREVLEHTERVLETYMKSPEVRTQALDEFSQTIQAATDLLDSLDEFFLWGCPNEDVNSDETGRLIMEFKKRMEGLIRHRARVYAQQYQAEGFHAMRGFLWREMWINVDDGSVNGDFGLAILKRLGAAGVEINNSASFAQKQTFCFTATTASGLPRQIQRTLDLMGKLPYSATGEAFYGLLRIVDLYLYALVMEFVPKSKFFESKKASRTLAYTYMVGAKESLKEWLVSSNSSSPTDESRLCEMNFLDDSSQSYIRAVTAAHSLDFIKILLQTFEKPLTERLPHVERAKIASKMFIDLPPVLEQIQSLVRRTASERLCFNINYPEFISVYDNKPERIPPMFLQDIGEAAKRLYREIQTQSAFGKAVGGVVSSASPRTLLWDDVVSFLLDKYLLGLTKLKQCSAADRGRMAVHLATLCESFREISKTSSFQLNSKSLASKTRADEFIRAFYIDKPNDLWDWMRLKKDDFEAFHFQAIFETGLVGQQLTSSSFLSGVVSLTPTSPDSNGGVGGGNSGAPSRTLMGGTGRREWRLELDRIVSGM